MLYIQKIEKGCERESNSKKKSSVRKVGKYFLVYCDQELEVSDLRYNGADVSA